MIVRILGEGRYEVPESMVDHINLLDDQLESALENNSNEGFQETLEALVKEVKASGKEVSSDHVGPSDLVIPGAETTLEEFRELLSQEV